MTDRELMHHALNALITAQLEGNCEYGVTDALRERLAQPEPEPVAWSDAPKLIYLQVCEENDCDHSFDAHDDVSWCQDKINDSDIPYIRADTAPPQREWKGLTDENEIKNCWYEACQTDLELTSQLVVYFARAIEAKLKEKNSD